MPRVTRNPIVAGCGADAIWALRWAAEAKGLGQTEQFEVGRQFGVRQMGNMAVPSTHMADLKEQAQAVLLLMDLDGLRVEHSEMRRLVRALAEGVLARGRTS